MGSPFLREQDQIDIEHLQAEFQTKLLLISQSSNRSWPIWGEKLKTIELIRPKEGFFFPSSGGTRKKTNACGSLNGMKVGTNQQQGIRRDQTGEGVGGLHWKVGKRQTVGTNNCGSCADVVCGATTRRFPRQECGTKSAKRRLVLRSEAAQQQLLNPKPDPEAQPGTWGKNTNFLFSSSIYTCFPLSRQPLGSESEQTSSLSVDDGSGSEAQRHQPLWLADWKQPSSSADKEEWMQLRG